MNSVFDVGRARLLSAALALTLLLATRMAAAGPPATQEHALQGHQGAGAHHAPSATVKAPAATVKAPAASVNAAGRVQPRRFDAAVWHQLLDKGPRPAAYLFTTTTCATCPAAFEVLHQAVQAGRPGKTPRLSAVVMDADGPRALSHARHFAGMTALYVFDGFEPAIRQAVDPAWPNVTPYVVLIDRQGQLQRLLGQPDAASIRRWLH